jgi:hypothetical protein
VDDDDEAFVASASEEEEGAAEGARAGRRSSHMELHMQWEKERQRELAAKMLAEKAAPSRLEASLRRQAAASPPSVLGFGPRRSGVARDRQRPRVRVKPEVWEHSSDEEAEVCEEVCGAWASGATSCDRGV